MIIVTGANGTLGRAVVEHLLTRAPAADVGVSVREPDRADELARRGVRVRGGDFDDPASLRHAFDGATRVLLVSAATVGQAALRRHATAIAAAREAGAEHVWYTSHAGASPTSPFPPMPDHAATEGLLRDAGVRFTALRNGFYADTTLRLLGDAVATGRLVAPQDGPVAWTAHADLAEAAAVALTSRLPEDGPTPPLTGPETHDLADVARLASELTGRPIERVVVSDDEYRAALVARGVPDLQADMLLGMFAASRKGEFSVVDPTLERVLGHRPVGVREVLRAALEGPLQEPPRR